MRCTVSPALHETTQAWLLNVAAGSLRSLGRLAEAIEPLKAGIDLNVKHAEWRPAAIKAINLSETKLILGKVSEAATDAEMSINYADTDNGFERIFARAAYADVLSMAGLLEEAKLRFREAEDVQAKMKHYVLLYGVAGLSLLQFAPCRRRASCRSMHVEAQ